jgi:hypothetical protein
MATIVRSSVLWSATSIGASATSTSAAVPLDKANGFALHLTAITGTSPNVTFTYSLSCDGTTYTTPQSPVTIGANKAAADVMDFAPEAAKWMKITATNNNGSNAVTISATLAIQEI